MFGSMEGDRPAAEQRLLALVDILEPLPPQEIEHLALRGAFVHLQTREALHLEEDRRRLDSISAGQLLGGEAEKTVIAEPGMSSVGNRCSTPGRPL